MNDAKTKEPKSDIELEYVFDEPPQKVWRAISIPEFRERWLPNEALTHAEATSVTPGQEVRYRMRDNAPPFLESIVTFQIAPNDAGGTNLRIIHELVDARFNPIAPATANNNRAPAMLAA